MLKFILTTFAIRKQSQIWDIQNNSHEMLKRGSSLELPTLNEIERKTSEATRKISIIIKIIRILLSGWVSVAVTILFAIIWTIIEIIILLVGEAIEKTTCIIGTTSGRTIINYMMGGNIIMFAIVLLVSILVIILDIGLNLVEKKECDILVYFKDDPLFFRLEFLIIVIPLFTAFALTSIAFYINSYNEWVIKFGFLVIEFIIYYVYGGNILLITIIKKITQSKKAVDPTSINDVLGNKIANKLITEYAKKEWSQENILVFNEIQKYKVLKFKYKKKRANEIYTTYICYNAPIEINLPYDIQNPLKEKLQSLKDEEEESWNNIFDEIEYEVLKNIKDTFSRFKSTNEYQQWASTFKK